MKGRKKGGQNKSKHRQAVEARMGRATGVTTASIKARHPDYEGATGMATEAPPEHAHKPDKD